MKAGSRRAPTGVRGETAVRAGLVLAGVLLLAANLRAGITAVGPVLDEIRADIGISGPAASLLISLPLIGFGLVSPFAPGLARRFGLERVLAGSLLVLCLAIVARSLPLPGLIWAGTVVLGAAIAVMNVLLPALIKREYPERIGELTGVYTAIQSGVAALAAGFAVPIAGLSPAGWRLSLGVWSALALIGFAVFLPWLRARNAPTGNGSAPDGPAADSGPEPDTLTLTLPATSGPGRVWSSLLAWQVTLFLGLQSTVYYVTITWWPTIEQDHGVGAAAAGWHQLVFQLFGIAGALLAAALIRRRPGQSLLVAVFGGLAPVAVAGQILAPGGAFFWILLLGVSGGATITIALSLFGLRTGDHHRAASLSGMAQSVGYLIAATGPVTIGAMHKAAGGWTVPLLALCLVAAASVFFGVLAGRDRQIG